jgi:hypothetical protein
MSTTRCRFLQNFMAHTNVSVLDESPRDAIFDPIFCLCEKWRERFPSIGASYVDFKYTLYVGSYSIGIFRQDFRIWNYTNPSKGMNLPGFLLEKVS